MKKSGKTNSLKRMERDSDYYRAQFNQPDCFCYLVICNMVNQAIDDYNNLPVKSKHYKSAKEFLKSWNILKKGDRR